MVRRISHPNTFTIRLYAAGVFICCLAALAVSMWLTPDRRGIGTHEQLNLPPCMMVVIAGIPCPTCGMTTAFAYTVRGRWLSAFRTQPFAFLLALGTILLTVLSAQTALSARSWQINWYRLTPWKVMVTIITLFVLAWIYKVVDHLAKNP